MALSAITRWTSEIHPYVLLPAGADRSADAKLSGSAVHCQIEETTSITCCMSGCIAPVTGFDPAAHYALTPEEKAVLSCCCAVLQKVYAVRVPVRDLRRSFDENTRVGVLFVFGQPRGLPRRRAGTDGRARRAAGQLHMKIERPGWDALNRQHAPWCNVNRMSSAQVRTRAVRTGAHPRGRANAGQCAAQFDAGWLLHYHFEQPFDSGSRRNSAVKKILSLLLTEDGLRKCR